MASRWEAKYSISSEVKGVFDILLFLRKDTKSIGSPFSSGNGFETSRRIRMLSSDGRRVRVVLKC